jgi:hypothetical protein
MGWMLLVTWIVPGQPTNSYQTNFGSEAACQAARQQIEVSAQQIKVQMWQEAGGNTDLQMVATQKYPHVSAVCSFTDQNKVR